MHFLEDARFPKAPVLARRKVNFYFTRAKSADRVPPPPHSVWAPPPHLVEGGGLQYICTLLLPPHSVWALKQPLSLSYLILSYLFSFA